MKNLCSSNNICLASGQNSKILYSKEQILSFNPPKEPNYTIKSKKNKITLKTYSKLIFSPKNISIDNIPYWIKVNCYELSTNAQRKIICLHIINNSNIKNSNQKTTVVYSHSNNSDLGKIFPFLIDLSCQLKGDVISYDYSGYGHSNNKPKIENLIPNIKEVMLLLFQLHIPNENLLLFARDLGALPTTAIGMLKQYENIKGIIYLSPLFANHLTAKALREIKCPIFLIHGKNDPSFHWKRFDEMFEEVKNVIKWHPKSSSPEDIIVNQRRKFYSKLNDFLDQIKICSMSRSLSIIGSTSISSTSFLNAEGCGVDYLKGPDINMKLIDKKQEQSSNISNLSFFKGKKGDTTVFKGENNELIGYEEYDSELMDL